MALEWQYLQIPKMSNVFICQVYFEKALDIMLVIMLQIIEIDDQYARTITKNILLDKEYDKDVYPLYFLMCA